MRIVLLPFVALIATAVNTALAEPTLVQQLIASYVDVKTMRCDIRREVEIDGTLRTSLSRVWFQRPDRLRVDAVSPQPRGIVVNGTNIFKWVKGEAHGVRIPLDEAPLADLIQVRRVPATGQEYLLHVKAAPETELPATDVFPVRRGYAQPAPLPYTVVSMGADTRLGRVELFQTAAQTNRLLKVDYSGWREVTDNIWIPCRQETTGYRRNGSSVFETLRASSIVINQPIDPTHFDPDMWAKGVRFVTQEEMAELLQE